MKGAATVDEYIERHTQWLRVLNKLREIVSTIPELEEGIKWGAPIYTFEGKNILGIAAFKSYVGLWFHQGALLTDPHKVLINAQEGITKALRQWRFTSIDEINEKWVKDYALEAIENAKQGRAIKPKRSSGKLPDIPPLLADFLAKSKAHSKQFKALTPFKQKEYIAYIAEAKRETTQISRVEKIAPMILEGKGLNDKYR